MKKILCVFALVLSLFMLTACSKGNPKTAVWEGYDELSFVKFLEKGMEALIEEEGEMEYEVSFEEGWKDSDELDEDDLKKGKKAVTYTIHAEYDYDGDMVEEDWVFFMELDEAENTLKPAGYLNVETDGETYEEDEKSAKAMLKELEDMIED